MTGIVFIIVFCLNFVVFPCEGKISLPSRGDIFLVVPGTDVSIAWSFDDKIDDLVTRHWRFIPTGELLATINDNGDVQIRSISLPGVEIEKPSTLVLKDVDLHYNGTYEFDVAALRETDASRVSVIVAARPTVTQNCSTRITVDKGDEVTCLCESEGGNPPASVTWYGDGVQIGDTGNEEKILILNNVDKTTSGTYKCVAESYTLANETSTEIIVHFAPEMPRVTSTPENAVLGKSVTIKCEADAQPPPNYVIVHNNTRTVSTEKTYIIDVVNASHAGSYKCTAINTIGRKTFDYTLHVTGEDMENNAEESSDGLSGGAVAGIVIGVLLLLVIIIAVVWWCKFRGNKNQDRRTAASGSGDRSAPVYADVRKDPKSNEPTYAVLDKNALNTGGDTTAKRDSGEPTQYADIEFGVRGDLV